MPRNAVTNRLKLREIPSSLSFNGSTTTVVYSGAGVTGFASASSFSGWVKINKGSTTLRITVGRWGAGGSDRCAICFQQVSPVGSENYALQAGYYNGSAYTVSGTAYVPVDTWFHVAFTWDGTTARSYINGVLLTGTSASPASGATTGLSLGNQSGAFWKGNQSMTKLYTRVLTQDEITKLSLMQDDQVDTTGLWVDWHMDEGAGSNVTDYSGNSRTGTITSGTFVYESPMKARKRSVNANMVLNGDFEYAPPFTAITTGGNVWLDGSAAGSATNDLFRWYKINGAGAYAASFDSTTKYAGNYSIKMEETDATGRGRLLTAPFESGTTAALIAQYGIPASASTDYDVSAYIKTNLANASSVRIIVLFYTATGTQSGSYMGPFQASTQDFTLATGRFTTASTTAYLVIKLDDNTASGAAHQVWFDSVSLLPVYPEGRVPENGNLVKNFDFEVVPTLVAPMTTAARYIDGTAAGSAANSTYKYAVPSGSFGGGGSANFDSTVSHSGSSSLKLSTNAVGGSVSVTQYVTISEGIALGNIYRLKPLTSYTLTGWIKTSNAAVGSVTLSMRELNAATSTVVTNTTSSVDGTADWTQVSITFTTAASTVYGALILRNNVTGNVSDAWFDDLYFGPTTNPGRVAIT